MWYKFKKSAQVCSLLIAVWTPVSAGQSPLCTRDNALDMIKQQLDVAKTLSYPFQRVMVLIRAADLLWPHQQDRARAILTEAFELATELEKENAERGPRSVILRMRYPDQRYVVIRAVAKRDPRWAKELTGQMLRLGDASPTRDSFSDLLTAERLLDSARILITTDLNAAIDLARYSLQYRAGSGLTRFLYALARVNRRAADEFYSLALMAYAKKPVGEFLYLQAYPFGLPTSLNTPVFAYYEVPTYLPATELSWYLRRQFVTLIVLRAQRALEEPSDDRDNYRGPSGLVMPPTVNLLQSLMELEPHVKGPLLDLLPAVTQAREKLLVSLSAEMQKLLLQPGREISLPPTNNFDEEIEAALKVPDVNRREDLIATAVLDDRSNSQPLEKVLATIEKIADANVREQLVDSICFRRAIVTINARQYGEAEKLISRIRGHEQRAYLYTEIAKGLLNNHQVGDASEFLDQAISEAKKAGANVFVARALLTASSLYAKIDVNRSIAVLTDAVNSINKIEDPDFVRDDQSKEIVAPRPGGRSGDYLFHYYMPGLDPQTAIGHMAKFDFDTALAQSNALTDKLQRSLSTLALAEVCLKRQQSQEKPKKTIP